MQAESQPSGAQSLWWHVAAFALYRCTNYEKRCLQTCGDVVFTTEKPYPQLGHQQLGAHAPSWARDELPFSSPKINFILEPKWPSRAKPLGSFGFQLWVFPPTCQPSPFPRRSSQHRLPKMAAATAGRLENSGHQAHKESPWRSQVASHKTIRFSAAICPL